MSLKSKILIALIVLAFMLFASLDLGGYTDLAYYVHSAILPLIAILYLLSIKEKTLFFSLFVYLFALSEFIALFSNLLPSVIDYYSGNILYILAYACLFIEILRSIDFKQVLKNFLFHLIVLMLFSIYALYELQDVQKDAYGYTLELLYNTVLVLLLSGSLINYFYRDDRKSLYLFFGSMFLVAYEVILVAYLYITQKCVLNITSTIFLLAAFYFLYQQNRYKHSDEKQSNFIVHL
ncbi:hypothetical protein V8G61_11380 [Gaetbulibacter sp. M240]|uniref:hypothetical protein n=1 Tax=Gaetbulibacter sp. M240 TaxID=3126511 RepID=UPI00374F877A